MPSVWPVKASPPNFHTAGADGSAEGPQIIWAQRLWEYKSQGVPLFSLPPWKHQLELDLCPCAMSQWGVLCECGVCREPGEDPVGDWRCHCKEASVPAGAVWGDATVTPGMTSEGSERKVPLTSGKCEDTGPEMEADRYAVLRVAEISCFAPFLPLAVSSISWFP